MALKYAAYKVFQRIWLWSSIFVVIGNFRYDVCINLAQTLAFWTHNLTNTIRFEKKLKYILGVTRKWITGCIVSQILFR